MGVPSQGDLELSYSPGIPGSVHVYSGGESHNSSVAPPPSNPIPQQQQQQKNKKSDSKLSKLNTATFAPKETTQFDCGSTVEMWYMCRWLSPRRRHSSCSDDDDCSQQQPQPQRTESTDTESARHKNSCNPKPIMDGAADDEEGDCEGLMLETEVDCSGDCSHGDGPEVSGAEGAEVTGHCGENSSVRMAGDGLPGMERDESLKEQLAMVEVMVQEMKVGFMAALEQLSSMQDGEQGGWKKLEAKCQRQDQQISDLSQSLKNLRHDVSALTSNVGKVISTQISLQDRLDAMQSSQQHLLDELISAGVLTEKSRTALSQCEASDKGVKMSHVDIVLDSISGDVNNHGSSQPDDVTDSHIGRNNGDSAGVTAAACKSLSLTQALAARCQDVDFSDSSEDDLESSFPRRKAQHDDDRLYKTPGNSADSAQRQQAVQEIIDSEQEYCSQLLMVVNVYQLPLQEGHYMSSRNLSVLFPSALSELCEQHLQMLHSLQDRLVHWSYAGVVGDVFARMTDSNSNVLGLYQEYVEGLPAAISCLRRQLAQSRSFRAFIKAQREASADADLMSLLISPLQRIPKYMLQLQQVLRHTREDHPDHFNLQISLSKLQDFVERFNQDITHTTQTIALDLQHLQAHGASFRSSASGSSYEVLPVTTSTCDSSIHSAEDTFPRGKQHNSHFEHGMYLPNWLEQSTVYRPTDPRHVHIMGVHRRVSRQSRLASNSQPDLTYTGCSIPASPFDPQATVLQICSQSKLPPAADCSARQRRYKIKKRIEGQGRYLSQSPSPHLRPASAIDFVSQREPQQRPEREQVMMRPHSVLGPFPGNGRNRVIQVYSRKQATRMGDRQRHSDAGMSGPSSVPLQHHMRGSPQPQVMANGHWDSVAGGDRVPNNRNIGLVDYTYDDDEDDTRAMSDAHSQETSSSHKLSSHHSQDAHETETDNSDDYTQEDLAASLSHHLTGGSLAPVATSTWTSGDSQQLHFIANELRANGFDNDTDYLESSESGVITTDHLSAIPQQQQPLEDMSELKLDLTCFLDDNEGQTSSLKKVKPAKEMPEPQTALSMQPIALNVNNSAEVSSQSPDPPPQNQQKEEEYMNSNAHAVNGPASYNNSPLAVSSTAAVVNSASPSVTVTASVNAEDKWERKRSLPPLRRDVLPTVSDTNSHVKPMDFDRPPVRRSATPQEHSSNVDRPVLPRAAVHSEYIGASDGVESSLSLKLRDNGRQRSKDSKHTSAEHLHRSVEDVSTTSKKKHFRTSLKNLFNRKKGSVILDELEREYTKELVRQCLNRNGHTQSISLHSATTTTTTTTATTTTKTAADVIHTTSTDRGRADGGETTHISVCDNSREKSCGDGVSDVIDHVNNNHHNNNNLLLCNNHSNGFFAKMRRSPLFLFYRNSADASTDTPV